MVGCVLSQVDEGEVVLLLSLECGNMSQRRYPNLEAGLSRVSVEQPTQQQATQCTADLQLCQLGLHVLEAR